MGMLRLSGFTGMWPVRDSRALPDAGAALAINIKADGGAYIRGVPQPAYIKDLKSTTRSVYRLPNTLTEELSASYWMEFDDINTDVVRAPIVNDSFKRIYWCSPSTGLKYQDYASIIAESSIEYDVGVVPPETPPDVEVVAGTGEIDSTGKSVNTVVTRQYIVTFINVFGEESQPCLPAEETGAPDQNWLITDIPQPASAGTRAAIETIRLYRTVTGESSLTSYYKVVDLAPGTTFYTDVLSDLVVTGQGVLGTSTWAPPPGNLQGLLSMPNGIFVSWYDNNVVFTEDYRPHAWPAEYQLTVDHPIVGMGLFGNTAVVCTTGSPVLITGSTASSMTLSKIDTPLPCLSRRGIVSAPEGVYYPTDSGLVLVGPSGLAIVTNGLITREQWALHYDPGHLRATSLGGLYLAVGDHVGDDPDPDQRRDGFDFVPTEAAVRGVVFTDLFLNQDILNVGVEPWTGKGWAISADSKLYQLQKSGAEPLKYTWRSKEFKIARPVNLAVMEVYFDDASGPVDIRVWASVRGQDSGPVRMIVFDQTINHSGRPTRMQSGFKADVWQVEVVSEASEVQEIILASSVMELRNA